MSLDGLTQFDPLNAIIDFGSSLLGLSPEAKDVVKLAVGAVSGDLLVAASGVEGLVTGGPPQAGPETEYASAGGSGLVPASYVPGYAPPYDPTSAGMGPDAFPPDGTYAAPPGSVSVTPAGGAYPVPPPGVGSGLTPWPTYGNSALDPNIIGYRDCLRTLEANFETFEKMGGRSGAITRRDLMAIRDDPGASVELKQAADFLLGHPEYFNRLAKGPQLLDLAHIGMSDIQAELSQVNQQLSTYGMPQGTGALPPGGESGGGTPAGGPGSSGDYVRNLLSNPNMSIDEKIQAVLQHVIDGNEDEAQSIMDQMSALQDQKAGTKDQAQAGKLQQSLEQLQIRLQDCMTRRQEMYSLRSNLMSMTHQMDMVAIQNMRGG